MVSANLRLVAAICGKITRESSYTDNLQNGTFGLIRAAERYDPERGYKFSTFAYWWIKQAIAAGLLAERPIRLPQPVDGAVRGIKNGACSDRCREAGELAATGWKSLDCIIPGGEETSTLAELLPAPAGPSMEDSEALGLQQQALEAMREREPDSVAMLELFHGESWGITEIAGLAGIGYSKARKNMKAAITTLRELPEVRLALAELVD
jgi:RNA polymerase sigma factor (sigma-70 family)